jgi:hypothetical protein
MALARTPAASLARFWPVSEASRSASDASTAAFSAATRQRLLGTVQFTPLVNAEGRTYGGEVTAPRRADYWFYTVMCTEPVPQ